MAKQQLSQTGSELVAKLKRLNYQYELIVGHYVMEGWERVFVNALIFTCVAFIVRMVISSFPLDMVISAWNAIHMLLTEMALQFLKKLNYQYEVTTGLYMLEAWEKYIVNGVVFAGFSLLAYTAINHLPTQGMNMVSQLSSYATA